MEGDSSADDLLIDVDEEDFALTAEELEEAEEMLGSKTGKGVEANRMEEEPEQMREMLEPELGTKEKLGTRTGHNKHNDVEVKQGQSKDDMIKTSSLAGDLKGAAVTEKVSTIENFGGKVAIKEECRMGGSKFTVKKVSRPGQQTFAFGKSTSQLPKPSGSQSAAPFTFGNWSRPEARFGLPSSQTMPVAIPTASMRDPRRGNGTAGARHINGLSPASATTSSAVAHLPSLPMAGPYQESQPRTSSSIALQRMGPSALERMAAEQERKCQEENTKREQLQKMVAAKNAKAGVQGLGHQGLEVEAQRLERERRELEFERRRLEEEKTLVATQKKVVELQEELLKLKQEKSENSGGGQSNMMPIRDRVGKRNVRDRVGGEVVRRKDMSVKERVGEVRGFSTPSCSNWAVVFNIKDEVVVEEFVESLKKVAPGIGLNMAAPKFHALTDNRPATYVQKLNVVLNDNPQIVMVIIPNDQGDHYTAVKKKCKPTPSQCITINVLNKAEGLMRVASTVAGQMLGKLGEEPWAVGNGMARRQNLQPRGNVGVGRDAKDQLAYCSDRFRQGLEESLECKGEDQTRSGGRRYNHQQEVDNRGHNKKRYRSGQPIPEELVLTELTDAGPVKKENFVGRVQAKFSDESSEEEEEEDGEEYGQPGKSKKRHW